jgi:hypothetical protein
MLMATGIFPGLAMAFRAVIALELAEVFRLDLAARRLTAAKRRA